MFGFVSRAQHEAALADCHQACLDSRLEYRRKYTALEDDNTTLADELVMVRRECTDTVVRLQDKVAHLEAVITEIRAVLSPAVPEMRTTSGFVQPTGVQRKQHDR